MTTIFQPNPGEKFFDAAARHVAKELRNFLIATRSPLISVDQAGFAAHICIPKPEEGIKDEKRYKEKRRAMGKQALKLLEKERVAKSAVYDAYSPGFEQLNLVCSGVVKDQQEVTATHRAKLPKAYGINRTSGWVVGGWYEPPFDDEIAAACMAGRDERGFGLAECKTLTNRQGFRLNSWRFMQTSLWLTMWNHGAANVQIRHGCLERKKTLPVSEQPVFTLDRGYSIDWHQLAVTRDGSPVRVVLVNFTSEQRWWDLLVHESGGEDEFEVWSAPEPPAKKGGTHVTVT